MTNPIVSVIMLTYNREKYLAESIASVLSQTFHDLELIILDDGSTDNSESLIKHIDDIRIQYYKFDHSGWASRLRNFGLNKSAGKYIAFIDSDDIWLHEKIQIQVNAMLGNPSVGFSFTNVIEFNNEGKILKNGIYKDIWNKSFEGNVFDRYVQSKFAIYPSTILFDRTCLLKVGNLNERFPWTDNELFHRLAFNYLVFVFNEPLVKIRKHAENHSIELGREPLTEVFHMLETFLREGMINKSIFRKITAHYSYHSGILYLQASHYAQARNAFVNCVRHNPWQIKAWIRIILSSLHIRQNS